RRMAFEDLEDPRPHVAAERPDPAEELRVDEVASPLPPLHEAEVAGSARQVEEDDAVGSLDAMFEERDLHRVDHPRLAVAYAWSSACHSAWGWSPPSR